MSSQITISPSKRVAGRFISKVRRALQKALAEEAKKNGLSQSDIARAIGVDRSVIHREIRGHKDITLGRVGELAWALGRKAEFSLPELVGGEGTNVDNSQIATSSKELFPISNSRLFMKGTLT